MRDKELLKEKPLVDEYLNRGARPLTAFSFVSIFAWCDFFDFEFMMINDCLCIFAHAGRGCFLYLPPLGAGMAISTIDLAFEHMTNKKGPKAVNRIENIPENSLSAFDSGRYNQYLKPPEYVYRKEDLIALKGNAYKSKRHDCNFFAGRQEHCSFEPYTDADLGPCLELYGRWADSRARTNTDEIYRAMLQENRQVHGRLLQYWDALGLFVRVLKIDGKITGYTFGFVLDEKTFCVYAEITDLKISGAAAFMFRSFCADKALTGFNRINTMDDFAMPQVARAKQAYRPSELIKSYTVSLKV